MATRYVPYEVLESFTRTTLLHSGLAEKDAATVADCLLYANLAGVDSHGIVHLRHYLRRLANGSIKAQPRIRYSRPGRALLQVDGDDGLGHVVTARAIDHGLEICATEGTVAIVIANSSHFGMAAYHVRKITLADVVGMVMTHTDARIVPTGARKPFFGTNPVAFGFPTFREPLILDFATSSVPFGKISVAKVEGRAIPLDWGLDTDGDPTADPSRVVGLHPIAGHKGSGLAMIIDLFCSIFSGMAYGPHINRMFEDIESPRKLGHFITLWDIGAFMPVHDVKEKVDEYLTQLHTLPRRDPATPIYFPGELEALKRAERLERGIPLDPGLLQDLRELGKSLGVRTEGLE